MPSRSRTVSLVAEKALRYLRDTGTPADSLQLAREILATSTPDETTARRILETAFAGDPRLAYEDGHWQAISESAAPESDPPRSLLILQGGRPGRGRPFRIETLHAVRMEEDLVVAACGGELSWGPSDEDLRESVREALDGSVAVVHDPPGSLESLERWLDEPVESVISLRRLGQFRCGLNAGHELEALAEELGISWRRTEDPLDQAEALDACLEALRGGEESLEGLLESSWPVAPPLDWNRFDFDRGFLRALPAQPGTYRFLDAEGNLLYIGKSNNLQRRIGSYFREGNRDNPRVRALLTDLHRIEFEPSGSDLEAVLREAERIREDRPSRNVQREVHARSGVSGRLRSILILEPAEDPLVLRAYLIRDGRMLDRVGIGPRGGGLLRIERILEDHFFSASGGPTPVVEGPDLDVEMIVRWLNRHRDRAVAFDPTNLGTPAEVTDRLRWFLSKGSPLDPDGLPILTR